MPIFGVENLQNIINPQSSQEWDIQFLAVPAMVDLADAVYRVLGAALPSTQINGYDRWFMGHAFHVPTSHQNHGTIQCSFEEDDAGFVMEQFVRWRNFIKDARTGRGGTRFLAQMKGTLIIQLLDRTHQPRSQAYILRGVMPTQFGGGQLTYEGNAGALAHSVTFQYDTWDLGRQGFTQFAASVF
jgi:hypothetical protein